VEGDPVQWRLGSSIESRCLFAVGIRSRIIYMSREDTKKWILEVAKEIIEKNGSSFAQEQIVLRIVADRLKMKGDQDREQFLLTCWNELFRDGTLSWGFNIDNPSRPWFHFTHV
jgi:hypothetical protein